MRPGGFRGTGAFDFGALEYPAAASTAAHTITYSRINTYRISRTGLISPDGRTLTVTHSIYRGDRIIANGIAIFEKTEAN